MLSKFRFFRKKYTNISVNDLMLGDLIYFSTEKHAVDSGFNVGRVERVSYTSVVVSHDRDLWVLAVPSRKPVIRLVTS